MEVNIPEVWMPFIVICIGMIVWGFTIGFLKIYEKLNKEKEE